MGKCVDKYIGGTVLHLVLLIFQVPYKTITFEIASEGIASEYFMVDSSTGKLSVKKGLYLDTSSRTEYTVSGHVGVTYQTHRPGGVVLLFLL